LRTSEGTAGKVDNLLSASFPLNGLIETLVMTISMLKLNPKQGSLNFMWFKTKKYEFRSALTHISYFSPFFSRPSLFESAIF